MSAGICGKRLGFEEIFGSAAASSSQGPPSAKRSRCSPPARYASFGPDEKLALLLRMFPSMDQEVVETVLNAHDHKIDDAIRSLHALCIRDISAGSTDTSDLASALVTNSHLVEGENGNVASEEKPENALKISSNAQTLSLDGSSWVDTFVQEMMKASNWEDIRVRVANILEVFEKHVITNCKPAQEQEFAVLKEQLQCLLRENQILKRAIAIQHERNLENDGKLQEVQQLKLMINQYQEQVRTLELNNYTLKVHLQRAQDTSSIPNRFHPDIC